MNFLAAFARFLALALVVATFAAAPSKAQETAVGIQILRDQSSGWVRLNASAAENSLLILEASPDLQSWTELARLHGNAAAYPDAAARALSKRFYRAWSRPRAASDDWKNALAFAGEPFRSPRGDMNDVRWVKFSIITSDPTRVYFQDTAKYPFHHDFATQRLAPFIGMSRPAFDAVSLHPGPSQQVILGSILFPPEAKRINEFAIQLVGLDEYPAEFVAELLEVVSAAINAAPAVQPVYMPTWEQFDAAARNAEFFASRGFPVASTDRWLGSNPIYSAGWALGRLVFIPAAEIRAAYADGRLRPADILLTDGVPAETPLVAGIISLRPSTPNSHVAILARSFAIPFVYLQDADERQRVQALAGREVALRAQTITGRSGVKVLDVENALSPELRTEILALKEPLLLNIPVKASFGSISAPTDNLVPADARFFGGKAANYGLLRRRIPGSSPPAIAFSFDLWDAFLDQLLTNGKTLRTEISERLAPHTSYPPNIAALGNVLAGVRDLVTDTAQFTPAQQDAVRAALSVFDPSRNIRFRSSTNMEDAEQFTGAGLYDSYSGCLDDDLDGDTTGPSCCDGTEPNERGVFRAIKKVYASFYNENAYLERLRHGIDEAKVGMALLVHHSFPNEAANGVATLELNISPFGTTRNSADLVTQVGEVSVANPEGDALPELVEANRFSSGGTSLLLKERSTLVPLGAYVLAWESDYLALMNLLVSVADGYRELYPTKKRFLLDFEYKKEGTAMVVKQVRPIPLPATVGKVVPFLLNEPATYVTAQGSQDVFTSHRLKSKLTTRTRNVRLSPSGLQSSFYADSRLDFVHAGAIATLVGPPSAWPAAAYNYSAPTARDRWTIGTGPAAQTYQLETTVIPEVSEAESPLLTSADFGKTLALINNGQSVLLVPESHVTPGSLLQTRSYTTAGGVTLQTTFYWPEPPSGPTAGYTAPLQQWVETRITGLISQPIVLRGYFSQTYGPTHHNFSEHFLFEPRLEENMPVEVLSELEAADVQMLHFFRDTPTTTTIAIHGFNGQTRPVP